MDYLSAMSFGTGSSSTAIVAEGMNSSLRQALNHRSRCNGDGLIEYLRNGGRLNEKASWLRSGT